MRNCIAADWLKILTLSRQQRLQYICRNNNNNNNNIKSLLIATESFLKLSKVYLKHDKVSSFWYMTVIGLYTRFKELRMFLP